MERLHPFELQRPMNLAQAAAMLADHPAARLLAGGTDLLPNLRRGIEQPTHLVDLAGVRDLGDITLESAGLTIGAGVTLARLAADRTHRARVARALAGRGQHRRARPPQRRHRGRQPLPRHALRVLQPE